MVCPSGHLLTPDNVAAGSTGYEYCRTCKAENQRTWQERVMPHLTTISAA